MEMIYRNIEKLVLDTPNNMELGEKLRELYWKEREENDRDLDIWYVDNIHDIPSIVEQIPTPHLPSEDELFNQAMREQAEQDKQDFLKKRDGK